MPVAMWNSPSIGLLEEPLDTVLSDDIWKKFDLDTPLDMYTHHHDRAYEENESESYSQDTCYESRKIRHHDCMWAGLCISKEHNRTLPAKRDSQIHRKVPAGRSLLISRATPSQQSQSQTHYQQHRRNDCLESDGDSTRPETPPSSTVSDTESEADVPIFKHDQISINEKLSECMSMTKAAPVSEVTGQLVRKCPERRKIAITNYNYSNQSSRNVMNMETEIRNTLSDHCYHINQPDKEDMDHLGVQTPSDSEEEIDVVNFEKPCRPPMLLRQSDFADQQMFRRTGFKKKPEPKQRGRPRKIDEDGNQQRAKIKQELDYPDHILEPVAKRPKRCTYKRKTKIPKNEPPTPMSPIKSSSSSRSSSDDEPDIQKRHLHNDMERRRRIDLRKAYEDLRRLVPQIQDNERVAKVTILQESAHYCTSLTNSDRDSYVKKYELVTRLRERERRLKELEEYFIQIKQRNFIKKLNFQSPKLHLRLP